ncbi:PREDICTED: pathogenesis-related protein PR-1-like isoform X3 [Lupinus angustifolius]|uniref:pathogenesis-related protein PR-1-like isoform X2 n=1 Tax=Lupinus angustifolius TaxID=3871 RepID=UPI00092FA220|nr:PREDICTED: pathogenesis-related protein PR-1-like isoform X2 [Lupinus angustifolius]XP_019428163.1 PREDICTED: pathogenesis-related protein PR-1-like isoform X3 [Lupinus angustifolius]
MHSFIVAIFLCNIVLFYIDIATVSAQSQLQSQSQSQPSKTTPSSPSNTSLHAPGGGHHGSKGGHHRVKGNYQVAKAGVPSQNPPSPPVNQNQNVTPPQPTNQGENSNQTIHDANPGKLFGYVPRNDTSDSKTLSMDEFLHAHNWVRSKYNLSSLTWDMKLENFASSYLMVRYEDCKMIHSTSEYGENLFWGKKLHWKPSDAVYYWYDEYNWYDLKTLKCSPQKVCGHFTQLVWKDSIRVGCALQHCKDRSLGMLIACEYDPPGNYPDENPLVSHNTQ